MATILVVEDDKLSQRLLAKMLGTQGHTALVTDTVGQAWELLQRPTFADLVVLDNQLSKGWGWELLQQIRTDVIFQPMPVVVYTGHTERSSVLKYVEYGVQAMLVKPYKADVLLSEVRKAVGIDWLGRLIESPETASRRLAVKPSEYLSMMMNSAVQVGAAVEETRDAIRTRPAEPRISATLGRISNESTALGMPILRLTVEALDRAVNSRNSPEVKLRLRQLELLQHVLKHRAHVHMGLKEVSAPAARLEPIRPVRVEPAAPITGASPLQAFARRTAGAPLWSYAGPGTGRAGLLPPAPESWSERYVNEPRPPSLEAIVKAVQYLHVLPGTGVDELGSSIAQLPAFEAVYLNIAMKLGSLEEGHVSLDIPLAIHRLGVYRSGVILACGRLASAPRAESPLDLTPLLLHTLTTTLLAYDVAQGLRIPDEHLCASAGLVHDVGKWILAMASPLPYGYALSLALQGGLTLEAAEREVFGLTHEAVGAGFLRGATGSGLLEEAAAFHSQPNSAAPAHRPLLATVALANQLAWAAAAETEQETAAARKALLRPANEVWAAFAAARTELPMDIPELVDTFGDIARTAFWVSTAILEWANSEKKTAHPKVSR